MAGSAAIAVLSYATYENVQSQREAAHQADLAASRQQEQYKEEQKKAEIQNLRSVREQIRAARVAQASMVNQAALTGGTGGSAAAGGQASVGSQLSGNLSYMSQIAASNTRIGNLAAEAAGYQAASASASAEGAIWGTIGQAATTGYNISKK